MVVVLREVQFEHRSFRPAFLQGVDSIQTVGGLFQTIVRIVVSIRGCHSARLRIPGVNIGSAKRPARHIPVLHVIHRAEEYCFLAVGVKVGAVIPPDIKTTIRGGIGWRHTLQEVALLTIGFNPGPFQTQIQHIGRFIAKGDRLQPRGAVVDVVDAAVADFIAGTIELIAGA